MTYRNFTGKTFDSLSAAKTHMENAIRRLHRMQVRETGRAGCWLPYPILAKKRVTIYQVTDGVARPLEMLDTMDLKWRKPLNIVKLFKT